MSVGLDDQTTLDFDSLRARLNSLYQALWPNWPVDKEHHIGNVFRDAVCTVGHLAVRRANRAKRESHITTAEDRLNMINGCRGIDYELSPAVAAAGDLTLALEAALAGTLTVPAGTVVRTPEASGAVRGMLVEDVVFAPGETEQAGQWIHALEQPNFVIASTGKTDQEVYLPFGPYLDGSAVVSTPTQPLWEEVDLLLESGPSDLHYTVRVDHNDRAVFRFGDGLNGAVPVGDITIKYFTGGGIVGNLPASSLTRIDGSFYDTLGNPAKVSVINPAATNGGLDRETVNAARVYAPLSVRARRTSVCNEDFEINAMTVGGVGRMLFLTSDEWTGIDENVGKLWVVPATGGTASAMLLSEVEQAVTLTYPRRTCFQVDVMSADYLLIDVEARIWIEQGRDRSVVKQAIEDALADFFSPLLADQTPNPSIDFGYNYKAADGSPAPEVSWSTLFNIVHDVPGVRKLSASQDGFLLNKTHDDVPLSYQQFPTLGGVTLYDGNTGNVL